MCNFGKANSICIATGSTVGATTKNLTVLGSEPGTCNGGTNFDSYQKNPYFLKTAWCCSAP